MAAAPPPVYTREGAGTYGLVVSPALPNVDEAGMPQTFPGMVSKVMIDEVKYKEALEAMEKLKQDAPALSFDFAPYRREYRFRNLPTAQMRSWMRNQSRRAGYGTPANDQRLYIARMPNLGKSFKEISDTAELRRAYRALGHETLLRQILKLCRVVKNVKDSGYVHADIRETNVLGNVQTGDLTIIDFDWLRQKDAYYREYPVFFYSHPPEEVFFFQMDNTHLRGFLTNPDRANMHTFIDSGLRRLYTENAPHFFWGADANQMTNTVRDNVFMRMYDRVQAAPVAERDAVARAEINRMKDASFVTVDSYGLGLSIVKLTTAVIGVVGPLSDFLINDWCARMLSYNPFMRQTIEQSIERLEKYIREHYPAIHLGEAPDVGDELARLAAIAELLEDKPVVNNAPRNVRQEVEALALITRYLEGGDEPEANDPPSPPQPNAAAGGGAASGGKRKTRSRQKKRKLTRRRHRKN